MARTISPVALLSRATLPKRITLKGVIENRLGGSWVGKSVTLSSTRNRQTGPRGGVYYDCAVHVGGKLVGLSKLYASTLKQLAAGEINDPNHLRYLPKYGRGYAARTRSLGIVSLTEVTVR